MKFITFSALLFLHLTCFGQCKIDKKLLETFCQVFKKYEVSDLGKDIGGSHGSSVTLYKFELTDNIIDEKSQDEIFYDIVFKEKANRETITSYFRSNKLDSISSSLLTMFILCKYESKYRIWYNEKKKLYFEQKQNDKQFEDVLLVVEEQPEFPGGIEKMKSFIQNNIKYPYPALISKTEGKVFVQFVIDYNGIIKNANIVKSIGYGCDEEALRIVNSMPKWKPGKQYGENVSVRYSIPVVFKLP